MYADNEPTMKSNEVALNDLLGDIYTTEANGKIPGNFKYSVTII